MDMGVQPGIQATTVTLSNENVETLANGSHTVMLSNLQNNVPVMNIVQGGQSYEILHTILGQGMAM